MGEKWFQNIKSKSHRNCRHCTWSEKKRLKELFAKSGDNIPNYDAFDPHTKKGNEGSVADVDISVVTTTLRDKCTQFGVTISANSRESPAYHPDYQRKTNTAGI